jgi:hypothetical protein
LPMPVVLLINWPTFVQIIWHTIDSGAPEGFRWASGAPDSDRTMPTPHILTLDAPTN